READLVREHEHDAIVHPAVLEAHLVQALPRNPLLVQASSTARPAPLPFGKDAMHWTRGGGGSLGFGVGASIGAKIAAGRERPVMRPLGGGGLASRRGGCRGGARDKH